MGYSRFLVSLYYVYGCALLKKGSSKVRTFPNSSGRHLYIYHKLLLFPPSPLLLSSFLPLSPLLPPLLSFFPSSFFPPHIPLLLTPLLSRSSPSFCSPFIPLSSLLPFFSPSHRVKYLLWISLDQFEMFILKYQSSMTFLPAHYGLHPVTQVSQPRNQGHSFLFHAHAEVRMRILYEAKRGCGLILYSHKAILRLVLKILSPIMIM